ncbi:hypothetical protein [Bordetella genomosp. 13]|uniref:hypothetical protein n=1 Tax=Bordetella genomosp. 13 TaxID=463040 RepID=UPI0016431411|nr:hypothetical protein [Bordetella genomosp. 13]
MTNNPGKVGIPPSTLPTTEGTTTTQSPLSQVQPTQVQGPVVDNAQSATQPVLASLAQGVQTPIQPLPLVSMDEKTTGRAITHKALDAWKKEIVKDPALTAEVDTIWKGLSSARYFAKVNTPLAQGVMVRFGASEAVHAFAALNPGLNLGKAAIDRVVAFIDKHVVLHANTRESFDRMTGTNARTAAFKTWFHGLAGTLSLMGARMRDETYARMSEGERGTLRTQQRQLIKAELMRGQLQATYTPDDADRLERSRSPIVREGYGRGVKTGLWLATAGVRTEQIKDALGKNSAQLNKFEVYPVNHAFAFKGLAFETLRDVPADLTNVKSLYIESLGVQIIRKDAVSLDGIDSFLGGRGLRTSPSHCADICADRMVDKLRKEDVGGALKTLDKAFVGEDARAVREALAQTELMPNTLIAPSGVDVLSASSPQQLRELRDLYDATVLSDTQGLPLYVRQNIDVVRNLMGHLDDFEVTRMPATVCGALTDALQRVSELLSQARFMALDLQGKARVLGEDNAVIARRLTQLNDPLTGAEARAMSGTLQGSHARALKEDQASYAMHRGGLEVLPKEVSVHMERFYQAMQDIHHVIRFQKDWTDRSPKLDSVIGDLLLDRPEGSSLTPDDAGVLAGHLKVESAPHALALLDQIQASLSTEERESVAILSGAYYETPALFPGAVELDAVDSEALRDKRVIVMEPHPNNAALSEVHPHDPVALIRNVFAGPREHPCTLVMDCTLNHLGEEQIAQVLHEARPHIESGMLNLVLVQSGTKFFQNGMDLVNIGTAAIFNKAEAWTSFQGGMDAGRMRVPDDDKGYIASMLAAGNRDASTQYLERVRDNTRQLRAELDELIPLGHDKKNAYEVCVNTDRDTVYVAFKPTPAYLAQMLKRDVGAKTEWEERAAINRTDYQDTFRPAFGDLAAVDRSSFGFNVTNFGECGDTVRITLGIEEPALLKTYAQRVVAVGEQLYAKAFPA